MARPAEKRWWRCRQAVACCGWGRPHRATPDTHSDTPMRTLNAVAVAIALLQGVPLTGQAPAAARTASPSHRAAAARLLEVTRARAAIEGAADAGLPAPLQGRPGMEAMQP